MKSDSSSHAVEPKPSEEGFVVRPQFALGLVGDPRRSGAFLDALYPMSVLFPRRQRFRWVWRRDGMGRFERVRRERLDKGMDESDEVRL
ncbi:hypothetical protein Isop_1179 [Isosphaera pallida ATCC 43644]|uniref:Uncharacterized protein n=1 Tax=Isosphaera pallida (strain ATCC 43644 / DSM 9630 / IS1B) TaxID=575540 RepID=E8R5L7_ISOPI|nr:hypothetical protein Isop_1179 [Isosphaera pallida ATCC 43644]